MAGAEEGARRSMLYRLGHGVARRRLLVLLAYGLIVLGLVLGARVAGGQFVNDFSVPGSGSQDAQNLLQEYFPTKRGATAQLVFAVTEGDVHEQRPAIEDALARAAKLPHVLGVGDPFSTVQLKDALTTPGGQVSGDKLVAVSTVQYTVPSSRLAYSDLEALEKAVAGADSAALSASVGGALPIGVSAKGSELPELIGVGAAVVILLFVLASAVAAGLPLVHAGVGLAASLSIIGLAAGVMNVSTTASSLATMVGLGVGIDYGLLSVNRFREEMRAGREVSDAVGVVVSTAGKSIAFAGMTVVVAIAGLAVAGIPAIQVMGAAAALTVAALAAGSLMFLPALLALAGDRVNRFNVHRPPADPTRSPGGSLAAAAVKRPWLTIMIGVSLLAAMSWPLTTMRLSMPSGKTAQPGSQQLEAYNQVRDHLAPGANGPLNVAMLLERPATPDTSALKDLNYLVGLGEGAARQSGSADKTAEQGIQQERQYFKSPSSDPRLVNLQQKIQKLHNVVSVTPGIAAEDPHAVIMGVTPISGPASERTQDLIDKLRTRLLKKQLGKQDQAYVGGATALSIDFATTTGEKMPLLIVTVLVLAFLLLMVAFRSVLVPLKAALLTMLPVGAGMGVLVLVFQHGVGAELLGIHTATPVFAYVPMLLFAIVFGLSIDYEVFLMSRVHEEQHKGGDARETVVTGIRAIARVVLAAASIMTAVFVAFFFEPDLNIKMLALGLATAIVCEALVISFAVSPAIMVLMGARAWHLPPWLDRILPDIAVEGEPPESVVTPPRSE